MYQFGQCTGCSKFILAIILLDFSFFSSNIARLCPKDPISVSQQFSYKFHDFFNTVIMKWGVLGTVDHYYWKEYQMRCAPHYHIVLWKRDSPVLGRDSPKKVLSFIQERITCHIPCNKTSPNLHVLVTKYQMHKCNAYCKRNFKFDKTCLGVDLISLDQRERWLASRVHNVRDSVELPYSPSDITA